MVDGLDTETFQRLVLANQYEMLACLDPDSGDDYRDLARQILSRWPLERLRPVQYLDEAGRNPLTAEDQDFVRDALELFDALQRADKAGNVAAADHGAVAFPGFCGNHETKYLSFLEWLHRQEHYTYVRLVMPGESNSHLPMSRVYRRMIDLWEALGRPVELDPDDAAELLAARRSARRAQASAPLDR
jgi:uncharacterized protein